MKKNNKNKMYGIFPKSIQRELSEKDLRRLNRILRLEEKDGSPVITETMLESMVRICPDSHWRLILKDTRRKANQIIPLFRLQNTPSSLNQLLTDIFPSDCYNEVLNNFSSIMEFLEHSSKIDLNYSINYQEVKSISLKQINLLKTFKEDSMGLCWRFEIRYNITFHTKEKSSYACIDIYKKGGNFTFKRGEEFESLPENFRKSLENILCLLME